jgi:hypothetical protein
VIYIDIDIDADIYIYIHIFQYIYIYAAVSNGKWKTRRFSLISLPFGHRANGSLSFVRLFTMKQTEVIRLQTDLKVLSSEN